MTIELTLDNTPYNPTITRIAPIVTALTVHLLVQFKEPFAHHVVVLFGASWFLLARWFINTWKVSFSEANGVIGNMFGLFLITLFTSMSIYRVLFHPLRHIPGPLSCKLSMWSWVLTDWFGSRQVKIQNIHKKYGNVVRIGPREVSVADPKGVSTIYGPTGPAPKSRRGPWYQAQSMIPHVHSLQNEPKIPDHNKRRRDWDPAFSLKALQSYEPNITRNAEAFIDQITKFSAKNDGRVDVKEPLMWFGFDVMGELGFGRSFGTLQDGKTSHEVELVELGVRAINTIGNVPYLANIMRFLPSPIAQFEAWLAEAVKWRKSKQGDREFVAADVFAYLLGEEGEKHHKGDPREIQQDCMLLVVAGSDTTSNTLALCLFELARQPALVERLREELEEFILEDYTALRDNAPLLNACLNETLRLWPAVPSGLQRETTLPHSLPGEINVPANTVLSTHTWTMHRNAENFYKPERYIPDRWITKKQPHNEKAFTPFGFGATSCIGKNLAFMEMRIVLAQFVLKFNFDIEPGDVQEFRQSIRDQFVVSMGSLYMNVIAR